MTPINSRALRWLLRAVAVVVAVAVAIGLFAMHTLPAMAAAPSMPGMSQPKTPANLDGGMAHASLASAAMQLDTLMPPMACGDHATCTAVLESAPSLAALPAVATTDITSDAAGVALAVATAVGSRSPPGVCLTRLCISRT